MSSTARRTFAQEDEIYALRFWKRQKATRSWPGSAFRALRHEHGLSRLNLAKLLGVSEYKIIRYEKSSEVPRSVVDSIRAAQKTQLLGDQKASRQQQQETVHYHLDKRPRSGLTITISINGTSNNRIFPENKSGVKISRSEWLRTTRLALGLSQQQLADELEVTRHTVNRWENGVHRISRADELAVLSLSQKKGNRHAGSS